MFKMMYRMQVGQVSMVSRELRNFMIVNIGLKDMIRRRGIQRKRELTMTQTLCLSRLREINSGDFEMFKLRS